MKANEPQLNAYYVFIDVTGTAMTCVAGHPDSESMDFHMDIGWDKFRGFADHIDQRSIDIYGAASEKIIARLRQKIDMLCRGVGQVRTSYASSSWKRPR